MYGGGGGWAGDAEPGGSAEVRCAGGGCVFRGCDSAAPADAGGDGGVSEATGAGGRGGVSRVELVSGIGAGDRAGGRRRKGWQAKVVESFAVPAEGAYRATWVLVSADPGFFRKPGVEAAATAIPRWDGIADVDG